LGDDRTQDKGKLHLLPLMPPPSFRTGNNLVAVRISARIKVSMVLKEDEILDRVQALALALDKPEERARRSTPKNSELPLVGRGQAALAPLAVDTRFPGDFAVAFDGTTDYFQFTMSSVSGSTIDDIDENEDEVREFVSNLRSIRKYINEKPQLASVVSKKFDSIDEGRQLTPRTPGRQLTPRTPGRQLTPMSERNTSDQPLPSLSTPISSNAKRTGSRFNPFSKMRRNDQSPLGKPTTPSSYMLRVSCTPTYEAETSKQQWPRSAPNAGFSNHIGNNE
jgi:hypothetical protein